MGGGTERGRQNYQSQGWERWLLQIPQILKENVTGNSLAVRWLGLCAFTAKGPGSKPGQGTKIPQAARRPKKRERECYEQLHVNKFHNLDEMDKFFERSKIQTLSQGVIANLKSPTFIKEIGIVVENLPTKKTLGLCAFTEEFYQIFKEEIISILHKPFPKNLREGNTSQLILWDQHYPDTKTRQRYYKKREPHWDITTQEKRKYLFMQKLVHDIHSSFICNS